MIRLLVNSATIPACPARRPMSLVPRSASSSLALGEQLALQSLARVSLRLVCPSLPTSSSAVLCQLLALREPLDPGSRNLPRAAWSRCTHKARGHTENVSRRILWGV